MAKTKYVIVSGFLGSGKTTTMIAMGRVINKKYGKGPIIANDLGAKNLVDADYTRTADMDITEITGDCICYVNEDLVAHIDRLSNAGADVVMSDIPGCGIGALDHVYIQLKEKYPEKYDLLLHLRGRSCSFAHDSSRARRHQPTRGDALLA